MLKYNIEDIKDKLKIINPNIEVLSPSYEGAHTKMKLKCLKDGYEWEACWNNLSNGTGCPKCARLNHPGFYSIKNAHRNKESFLKIPAILYVVEMEEDDQTFYKIGITTSNVSKRYQGRQVPYKYKILLETEMNLYRAILIEQTLVKQLKEQQYLPANKFPGHTECFICPVK
jgi:hypothetical protein